MNFSSRLNRPLLYQEVVSALYQIIDEQKILMNGTPDLCRATIIDGFLYNFSEYGCTVTEIS